MRFANVLATKLRQPIDIIESMDETVSPGWCKFSEAGYTIYSAVPATLSLMLRQAIALA
jgi:hypothetical protein